MLRALFELIITIIVVIIARAVLTAVVRGIAQQGAALRNRAGQNRASAPTAESAGDLYKDPVCGTYVAQSTPHRRQIGGQTFYYCSEACREKHALVTR